MKKILAIALLCVLLFSISIVPACVSDGSIEILSSEEMALVHSRFPQEVHYIETEKSIDLTSLSEEEWEEVKKIAAFQLYNPDYNFSGMMSVFTEIFVQKKEEISSKARWTQEEIIYHHPVRGFGPIKGNVVSKVPAASTYSGSYSISIDVGYERDGVSIDLAASAEGSCSYSGPSVNDVLPNGKTTTHHIVMGVMYGEIWYKEYELVTAFNRTRISYCYIPEDSIESLDFVLPAHLSTPTYAKSAVSANVMEFLTIPHLDDAIVNTPEMFVEP